MSDAQLRHELREAYGDLVRRRGRIAAFYVGNRAGRRSTFSIGGVYHPPR